MRLFKQNVSKQHTWSWATNTGILAVDYHIRPAKDKHTHNTQLVSAKVAIIPTMAMRVHKGTWANHSLLSWKSTSHGHIAEKFWDTSTAKAEAMPINIKESSQTVQLIGVKFRFCLWPRDPEWVHIHTHGQKRPRSIKVLPAAIVSALAALSGSFSSPLSVAARMNSWKGGWCAI